MPVDIISTVIFDGPEAIPAWNYIKTVAPALAVIGATKYYFGGTTNTWDRELHGKVYIITGGTSGVGAQLAYELATKGAQIILLVRSIEDNWTVEYVDDLREKTNNFMIYAEECDLASLYSVRKFATRWLDNQPPRRLDGVICCGAETLPIGKGKQVTVDGVERQIGINYLGHYHLLTLLSPSLRVQPPDRDVRVLLANCSSHLLGDIDINDLLWENTPYPKYQPYKVYGTSKLLLGMFCKQFQREHDGYVRKDNHPCNIRVNMVNPGVMRSAGTRRFLSMGSIIGLFVYLILYPIWWLFLKSSYQGCQSFLFAIAAPIFPKIEGGNLIQECKIITKTRKEYSDEELQKKVFDATEKLIEGLEKQSAINRKKQEKKLKLKKNNKDEDLSRKPQTVDELETKLDKLRREIAIPTSTEPLFPQSK
jgi:NAD(P)-dependent dehydrogenase (short-subunit alcohol dehydrogenase family)